jgi:hypothetical protein
MVSNKIPWGFSDRIDNLWKNIKLMMFEKERIKDFIVFKKNTMKPYRVGNIPRIPRTGNVTQKPVLFAIPRDATEPMAAQDEFPRDKYVEGLREKAALDTEHSLRFRRNDNLLVTRMTDNRLEAKDFEPTTRIYNNVIDHEIGGGHETDVKISKFMPSNRRKRGVIIVKNIGQTGEIEVQDQRPVLRDENRSISHTSADVGVEREDVPVSQHRPILRELDKIRNVEAMIDEDVRDLSPLIVSDRLRMRRIALDHHSQYGKQITHEEVQTILRHEAQSQRRQENTQVTIDHDHQETQDRLRRETLSQKRQQHAQTSIDQNHREVQDRLRRETLSQKRQQHAQTSIDQNHQEAQDRLRRETLSNKRQQHTHTKITVDGEEVNVNTARHNLRANRQRETVHKQDIDYEDVIMKGQTRPHLNTSKHDHRPRINNREEDHVDQTPHRVKHRAQTRNEDHHNIERDNADVIFNDRAQIKKTTRNKTQAKPKIDITHNDVDVDVRPKVNIKFTKIGDKPHIDQDTPEVNVRDKKDLRKMRPKASAKHRIDQEHAVVDSVKGHADLKTNQRAANPVIKRMSEEGYEIRMQNGVMVKGSRKDRAMISKRIEDSMTFVGFDPSANEKPAPRTATKRSVSQGTKQMGQEGEVDVKRERKHRPKMSKLKPKSVELYDDPDKEIKGENLKQHEGPRNDEKNMNADEQQERKIDLENPKQFIF